MAVVLCVRGLTHVSNEKFLCVPDAKIDRWSAGRGVAVGAGATAVIRRKALLELVARDDQPSHWTKNLKKFHSTPVYFWHNCIFQNRCIFPQIEGILAK